MDIKYHEDKILSLESQIDKLLKVATAVEADGMCKAFALEAMEVIPTFGKGTPMAYYSEKPSIAEHAIALEELSTGIIAAIIAATAALIVLITKFIKWLFGDKKDGAAEKSGDAIDAAEKKHDELDKHTRALELVYGNTLKDDGNPNALATENYNSPRPRNINELLDYYIKNEGRDSELARTLRSDDPLFHDVIFGGEYTKAIKSTAGAITVLPVSVTESANRYLALVTEAEEQIHRAHWRPVNVDETVTNVEPIEIDMFGKGKRVSIEEGVLELRAIHEKVKATHPHDATISFTKLNSLFSQSLNKTAIANIVRKIDNTKNKMDELLSSLASANKRIEYFENPKVSPTLIQTYYGVLRAGFKTTRADVMNCFRFFHELMQYATILHNMDLKLTAVHKAALRVIEAEIKKSVGKVPDEFVTVRDEINSIYSLG